MLKQAARESVDAVFISFYRDDKLHGCLGDEGPPSNGPVSDSGPAGPTIQDLAPCIDGVLADFPRFLSILDGRSSVQAADFDAFSIPPLVGAYYVSTLGEMGFDVRHGHGATAATLDRLAAAYAPQFVLFSTSLTPNSDLIREACQRIRAAWPEATLILGGLVAVELLNGEGEARFKEILEKWGPDACVVSSGGEQELKALLETRRDDWAGTVPASVYVREGGGYRPGTGALAPADCIDTTVKWDRLSPHGLYHTVHMRAARSCAFQCAFCSFPANQGPHRLRSLESLEQELQALHATGMVSSVIFTDDTLNVPLPRFIELCRLMKRFPFEWYGFIRPQNLKREVVQLMTESGFRGGCLGLESIDDQVLRNMNKNATRAAYERSISVLKEAGIYCHASVLIGFPGDRPENVAATAEWLDAMGLDSFSAWPFFMSPTTPIFRDREKFDLQGCHYNWTHPTMDGPTALSLTYAIRTMTRHTAYLDDLTTNELWGAAMLLSNGWTNDEVRQAARCYTANMGQSVTSDTLRDTADAAAVRDIIQRRPMAPTPGEGLAFHASVGDDSASASAVPAGVG